MRLEPELPELCCRVCTPQCHSGASGYLTVLMGDVLELMCHAGEFFYEDKHVFARRIEGGHQDGGSLGWIALSALVPRHHESWEDAETKTGRFTLLATVTGAAEGYLTAAAGRELEVTSATEPGVRHGCNFVFANREPGSLLGGWIATVLLTRPRSAA